ncbi:ATP-grasp domain-containing protein [Bailinhaonella thermotolerans]|uniref:ATP-grasp domain-containing protein n=1 Tax=Bailinhaonella thermotolerans TaxID=1070861 RepID=UPI00192A2226|nr:ATP-grasp domain-containing protein [Bailinhaonella thermotolerans]
MSTPLDAARADAAGHELAAALNGRPLVMVERFTAAGRTGYCGPAPLPMLRPALSIGCYRSWEPAQPEAVIAAEDLSRVRSPQTRRDWLNLVRHPAAALLGAMERSAVIAAWYGMPLLRELAGPAGTVAATAGEVRARIEDKIAFDAVLRQAGVPASARIPCVHLDRLPALAELRRAVGGEVVVVQAAGVSSGGRGTVIVREAADLDRAAALRGPYRVAAYIDGWPSNTTVLSIPDDDGIRVYVDRPSHKSVGVAALGIGEAKSAGNDWSSPWPAPVTVQLIDCAERIAAWAWREHRACGLFGLDALITEDGRVHLNEINWRNQGTTEVSGVNQQLRGLPPFLAAHLICQLGGRVGDWLGDPDAFNRATVAQAAAGGGPFYVKTRWREAFPARIARENPSGVYRLEEDGRLHFVRPGAHPADAALDHGQVLLANLPAPDITCLPGAELCTIEGQARVRQPFDGPDSASELIQRVHAAVHALFTPHPH